MVRKFLYFIAFAIVLVAAGLFALRIWGEDLTRIAMVPTTEFTPQERLADNGYQDPAMWFSRPGIGAANDPARWQPLEKTVGEDDASPENSQSAAATQQPLVPAAPPKFAVFFVHPTSYLNRSHWNAPLDDPESQDRAKMFVRGQASAFNQASEIWAPRYRQATLGAFMVETPEAKQALDAAYADVEQAFDFFLDSIDKDTPIVLAGHSQGALHIIRLLKERVAGTDLQSRIAAAYPIGWPISIEHDLPALGLPACASPDQPGCIASWSSYAEPADPSFVLKSYASSIGFDGTARGTSPALCVNPVNGTMNGRTDARANIGTLVPDADLSSGELVVGAVPARCDTRGMLLIGDPPELGPYVMPGNNYHVYDIPLFWRNLQQDVARRVTAWTASRS